jgi:hypothetical protein
VSGELPATHAEWLSEELWPDTKIGQGLLSLVIDDERRRQGVALDALTPELAAVWTFGLAELQGSYTNTPLEAIFRRLSEGDLAGAGHLLRRHVAHGVWEQYAETVVGKDSQRVHDCRERGRKAAHEKALDWASAKRVYEQLEPRHRESNSEAARQICVRLGWPESSEQAVRKRIAKNTW